MRIPEESKSVKFLLHACCAPCSVQCVHALGEEGIRPEIYWHNPNIHPYTEYRLRRDSLRAAAEACALPLVVEDEYGLRSFTAAVMRNGGDGAAAGRCVMCYRLRFEKTAAFAAENGYDAFSSTLLISPHQNHDLIREIGEDLAARYGVPFFYRDFRPRFRDSQNQARAAGYYMQKYCGCIYSEEERYLGSKKAKEI